VGISPGRASPTGKKIEGEKRRGGGDFKKRGVLVFGLTFVNGKKRSVKESLNRRHGLSKCRKRIYWKKKGGAMK